MRVLAGFKDPSPIARGLAQQEITYEGKYFCVIISLQKLLQTFQLLVNVTR